MALAKQQTVPVERDDNSLLILLIALIFSLVVVPILEVPIFEQFAIGRALLHVGVTAIIVYGVFANRQKKWLLVPAVVLATVAIPLAWVTLFVGYKFLFVLSCVLESIFFATMAALLLAKVLKQHLATVQSVFGAICVYLLLGLTWAMLYMALERVDHESLSIRYRTTVQRTVGGQEITAFSQLVYFSFVTLSTLGYGDIVPETSLARTLTWMQSVTGQFYLAILVARIVAELARAPNDGRALTREDPSGQEA